MFSSTLKRSAATLGVVAGLLAAAAPANADHQMKDKAVVVLIGANDYGWTDGNDQPTRGCDFC
jgi:lysophospholipase L1-like esterase